MTAPQPFFKLEFPAEALDIVVGKIYNVVS